ncbi:MAG: NADH-ubiquinone oxidoreductase subunit NDUFA12 family protein [Commensalibacter sp.]|nr:NADH-ubiquinone oxidoreductase subunit NDUFA12 family protein [Commensalibacter sp.]
MTTLGTRLHTMMKGRLVGKDADGRAYYESRKATRLGGGELRHERWVLYNKGDDPSSVPPEWWLWLHHGSDMPLPASMRKPWQTPHQPNPSGTEKAYHPAGSDYEGGKRPKATGDYQTWFPED